MEGIFIEYKKENTIKSPINYLGNKYRLLPQIMPLLPDNIDTFVDLFCGGLDMTINVKADRYICNDIQKELIDFYINIKGLDSEFVIDSIEDILNKYEITKNNKNQYNMLRNDYNNGENSWDMFIALVLNSYNNAIRFNNKGKFNSPSGKEAKFFNESIKKRMISFVDILNNFNIEFLSRDFKSIDLSFLNENDFVYIDPPYLITQCFYSKYWNESEEVNLLNLIDKLDKNNIKFALSNVFYNKGKRNDILIKWSKKYNVHYLKCNYANCNYSNKNKKIKDTIEVLITNY